MVNLDQELIDSVTLLRRGNEVARLDRSDWVVEIVEQCRAHRVHGDRNWVPIGICEDASPLVERRHIGDTRDARSPPKSLRNSGRKKVWFFTIGPPSVPPNLVQMQS